MSLSLMAQLVIEDNLLLVELDNRQNNLIMINLMPIETG